MAERAEITTTSLEVIRAMKKYECIEVRHHRDVAGAIEEMQQKGWTLRTYTAAGQPPTAINHYLLFEKDV